MDHLLIFGPSWAQNTILPNIFHFAMMKKGDGEDDFKPSNYFFNKWLESRGLVNEKNAQGNTPIHLLSLNQISDSWFVWNKKVDKKAYNNEDLTAYDIILRADISEKKVRLPHNFNYLFIGKCLPRFSFL